MGPRIALLAVPLLLASSVLTAADRDQYTVDLSENRDQVLHVLMVQEVVEGTLPVVRVRGGKVRFSNGQVTDRMNLDTNDLRVVQWLVSGKYVFRLYRDDGTVGLYRYAVLPRERRPRKGIWLEAIPLDEDSSFEERFGRGAETNLAEVISSAIDVELDGLRSDHAFLLATTS